MADRTVDDILAELEPETFAPKPAPAPVTASQRSVDDIVAELEGAPAPVVDTRKPNVGMDDLNRRDLLGAGMDLGATVESTSLQQGASPEDALRRRMDAEQTTMVLGPRADSGSVRRALEAREGPDSAGKAAQRAFGQGLVPLPPAARTSVERDDEARRREREFREQGFVDSVKRAWAGDETEQAPAENEVAADKLWLQRAKDDAGKVVLSTLTAGTYPLIRLALQKAGLEEYDPTPDASSGPVEGWSALIEGMAEDEDVQALSSPEAVGKLGVKAVQASGIGPIVGKAAATVEKALPDPLVKAAEEAGLDIGTTALFWDDVQPREKFDAAAQVFYETGDRSAVDGLTLRDLPARARGDSVDVAAFLRMADAGDPDVAFLKTIADKDERYIAAQIERLPLSVVGRAQPSLVPDAETLRDIHVRRTNAKEYAGDAEADSLLRLMGAGLVRPVDNGENLLFVPGRIMEAMRIAGVPLAAVNEVEVNPWRLFATAAALPTGFARPVYEAFEGAPEPGDTSLLAKAKAARVPTGAGLQSMAASGAFNDWLEDVGLDGGEKFASLYEPGSTWESRTLTAAMLPEYQFRLLKDTFTRAGGDPASGTADVLGAADLLANFVIPAEEIAIAPAMSAARATMRARAASGAARELGMAGREARAAAVAAALSGDGIQSGGEALRRQALDLLESGRLDPDAISPTARRQIVDLFRDGGVADPEQYVEELFDTLRDRRARVLDENAAVVAKGGPETRKLRDSEPYQRVKAELDGLVRTGNLTPADRDLVLRIEEAKALNAWDEQEIASPEDWFASQEWRKGVEADLASAGSGTLYSGEGQASAPRTRADVEASPEFKAWFGGSKVVDAEGRPLVVYHGTSTAGFDAFERGRGGHSRSASMFSTSPEYASQYADGGAVYPAYLKLERPLDVSGRGNLQDRLSDDLWAQMTGREQQAIIDANNANPNTTWPAGNLLLYLAEKYGFDGVIWDEAGARTIIPMQPTQIKSATGNRGTFDPNNPSILYSEEGGRVAGSIERMPADANLVVQHNLTPENLLYADKLGGLVAPSIGIGNVNAPYTGFGTITLIGPTSMADPAKSGIRWFDADVYSPRWPNKVYKVDTKKADAWNRANLVPYRDRVGTRYVSDLAQAAAVTQRSEGWGSPWSELKNDPAMKLKYIEEVLGQRPTVPTKVDSRYADVLAAPPVRDVLAEIPDADIRRLIDEVPEDLRGRVEAAVRGYADDAGARVLAATNDEGAAKVTRNRILEIVGMRQRNPGGGRPPMVDAPLRDDVLRELLYDEGKARKGPQPDRVGASRKFADIIAKSEGGTEAYERWYDAQLDAVRGPAMLVPDGKSRPKPYTAENILAELVKNTRGGENFNYGLGSARSKGAKEYRSLKGIQADRARVVSETEMTAAKQALQDEFDALVEALAPYYTGTSGLLDEAATVIGESYRKGVTGALKTMFKGVPRDVALAVQDFAEKLRQAPTEYLEGKAGRIVRFNEFEAAVVPDDLPAAAREVLERNGVELVPYKAGDNADRARAIAEAAQRKGALFQRVADTVRGFIQPNPSASRWLIRLFQTGDLRTAFHEGGHLQALMRPGWEARAAKVFDSVNGRLTREGHEQLADAVTRLLRGTFRPGSRADNLAADVLDTLGDLWSRVRELPIVSRLQGTALDRLPRAIPPEFARLWDETFRPHTRTRPVAARLVDERQPRGMRAPVFLPGDIDARLAASKKRAAGVADEFNRVDRAPAEIRAALGLKQGDVEADPINLLANAMAYIGTERMRRSWGFGELVPLTSRVAVPAARQEAILREWNARRMAALGNREPTPDGTDLLFDANQQAGLRRLIREAEESPLGEILPASLTDDGADLSRVPAEDYNRLMDVHKEIRAGMGAFRNARAEQAAVSGAVRLLNKAAEGLERTDAAPVLRKIKEAFSTSHVAEEYLGPAARDLVKAVERELAEVPTQIKREIIEVAETWRQQGRAFKAIDLVRDLSYGVGPEVVPVDEVGRLLRLGTLTDAPDLARVVADLDEIDALFVNAPLTNAAEQVATESMAIAHLDQINRALADMDVPDFEAAVAASGLAPEQANDAMGIVLEGIRRRVASFENSAVDILISLTGTDDVAILDAIKHKPTRQAKLQRVYDAWYTGRWDVALDEVARMGYATSGPAFDQGSAALTALLRLRSRQVLGQLAYRLADAGLTGDVTKLARGGVSYDRPYVLGSMPGGREAFIEDVANYISTITGWGDRPEYRLPVLDENGVEIQPGRYLPAEGELTKRGVVNRDAYAEAVRVLSSYGFKTGKGTDWTPIDLPGGARVMVPSLIREPLEQVINQASPQSIAFRVGSAAERIGDVSKGASAAKAPGVAVQGINAAMRILQGMWDYSYGMLRTGLLTGIGPFVRPAYYVGNAFGGFMQLLQGMGTLGAARVLGEAAADFGTTRRVIQRMYQDGTGIFGVNMLSPAERGFFGKDGRYFTDSMIANMANRAGLNSSLPKSEFAESLIETIRREEPTWWNNIQRIPWPGSRAWREHLNEGATAIDNFYRVSTFMDGLKRGLSETEAANLARRVAFDYNDLTEFERKFARRVIMFYTFFRRNQDLFWWTLLNHPERVAAQLRLMNGLQREALETESEVYVPDWMDDRVPFLFRDALKEGHATNAQAGRMTITPGIPIPAALSLWLDLYGAAGQPLVDLALGDAPTVDSKAVTGLVGLATPAVQFPFVAATETDPDTGRPLTATAVPALLAEPFAELDDALTGGLVMRDMFGLRKVNPWDDASTARPGAPVWQIQGDGPLLAWWAFNNMTPAGPVLNQATQYDRAIPGGLNEPRVGLTEADEAATILGARTSTVPRREVILGREKERRESAILSRERAAMQGDIRKGE